MTLPPERIRQLVLPYLTDSISDTTVNQLGSYLDLLLKWNAKTNLTAVREPEEIVRTHFGESLFAGQQMALRLEIPGTTLLDYGSGAGFPGLPIQILFPTVQVTVAESQSKKASFLREAIRTLELTTMVHAGRVEDMPTGRQFDVVTLRAVDNMEAALFGALPRLAEPGTLAVLTTESQMEQVVATAPLRWGKTISLPQSQQRILMLGRVR